MVEKGQMLTKLQSLEILLETLSKIPPGPSLNILLKLMSVVALVIAPSVALDSGNLGEKSVNEEHKITIQVKENSKLTYNFMGFNKKAKR